MCLVAILWKDMCLINIFDGLPACKVNTCVLDRFFFTLVVQIISKLTITASI